MQGQRMRVDLLVELIGSLAHLFTGLAGRMHIVSSLEWAQIRLDHSAKGRANHRPFFGQRELRPCRYHQLTIVGWRIH
jgi:hypothetical protein